MKKIIWIVFFVALITVNALAMAADYFGGVYIAMPYRLAMVLALTMISSIFAGAWLLLSEADKEKPNT